MKRLMLVSDSQAQPFKLVDFDRGLAMKKIEQGLPVVPFWSDRLHRRLRENLKNFEQ
jgi:hypothetical protein